MIKSRMRYIAVGFMSGVAAGSIFWHRLQHNCRRELFNRSAIRRIAALGYLRARPSVNTAQILREYIAWEPRPLLRQRGARILRSVETTL
jgi:hypothetical protein